MTRALNIVRIIACGIGLYLSYAGITMVVVVDPDGQGAVANLHLMQFQEMRVMLGGIAVLVGTIFFVGGWMMEHITAPANRLLQPDDLAKIDAWIARQDQPFPTRPEAIRRLAEKGLKSE